jgi:DNA-binding NtrC family response regulator/polyferredoxin
MEEFHAPCFLLSAHDIVWGDMGEVSQIRVEEKSSLDAVPVELKELLDTKGTVRDYKRGEMIIAPGDRGDRIGFILSGRASIVLREEGHPDVSIELLGPGASFGEISFLTELPSPSNWGLVAEEPCKAVEIDSESYRDLLVRSPAVATTLMKHLARKVIRLDHSIYETKRKKRALQSLISGESSTFPEYIVGNYVRRRLAERIEELAKSRKPVLIMGETGVGREIIAHTIFKAASDAKQVFLLVDILRIQIPQKTLSIYEREPTAASSSEEDQEELFFGSDYIDTDGVRREKPGYLELTDGGTLLVRGIEHVRPSIQEKLLRAIETGVFQRPGSKAKRSAKVRLICTSKLAQKDVNEADHPLINALLYRSIVIPPLRERRREIPDLAGQYLRQHAQQLNKGDPRLPTQTLKILLGYSWPGNDLELSNTIKRAVIVSEGGVIRPQDISFDLGKAEGPGKINLLRFAPTRQMFLSPLFPAILQSAVTPFFFILLILLFLGPADPEKNPGSLFSWALGWPALVAGALIWARFWCAICPMGTLGKLAKKVIALEREFPSALKKRSDIVVAVALLFIVWLETATDMRHSPMNLGLLLMVVTTLAVVVSVIFERQSWCRYLCPLGAMTGVLAKASWLELRADRNICASQCTSHECYFGTSKREGCPFGQITPTLRSNLECKLCGACVKNCPHGAINLNLRIPGEELWKMRRANSGTAFLIMGMVGGLLAEMIGHTAVYNALGFPPSWPSIIQFTIIFTVVIITLNACLSVASIISRSVLRDSFEENYALYGVALLPLALMTYLSFHVYYLINLGVQIPRLAARTLDLAIFQQLIITVPPAVTATIQSFLIWLGLGWSLFVISRIAKFRYGVSAFSAGILPHVAFALVLTFILVRAMQGHFSAL